MAKGAEINNVKVITGVTALMKASRYGHVAIVQALLAKGALIDHQNKYGDTALIKASWQGHVETVQLLLEKSANVNLKNKRNKTALKDAKTLQIKKLLKAAGATE